MRQEAVNTFTGGMIKDLHPMSTQSNTLTDALNATLVTYNGNEYILQNDMGNGRVETARLPAGFVPLGVKEYGGIIYVVALNPLTSVCQIGSFPSPERQITTQERKQNLKITGTLSTSNSYLRLDIGDKDFKLNPGDKFIIGGNVGDYLSAISQYNSSSNKLFKIHVGIVDKENNIIYIEDNLRKHSNGYWIYNGSIDAITDYQVFAEKTSGFLTLIVELESVDTFEVVRDFEYTAGRTDKDDARFGLLLNGSSTTSSGVSTNQYKIEYALNGTSNTSYSNTSLQFKMNDFIKTDVITYKITPFLKWGNTGLGYADALAVSGGVSFAMLGTGYCVLTDWKYFVEKDYIKINWGLDIDPLRCEIVDSVKFHFFSFTENARHTAKTYTSFKCNYRDNYNGNFVENIPFEDPTEQGYSLKPGDLYYVIIEIALRNKNTQVLSDSVYYRKFLYTSSIFNEQYLNIAIKDFSTLFLTGTVETSASIVNKTIEATPTSDTIQTTELQSTNSAATYFIYRKSNFTTKTKLKFTSKLDNADYYFGTLNPLMYRQTVAASNITATVDNSKETFLGSDVSYSSELDASIAALSPDNSIGAWREASTITHTDDLSEWVISKNGYAQRGVYAGRSVADSSTSNALCLEQYYDSTNSKDWSKLGAHTAERTLTQDNRTHTVVRDGPAFSGTEGYRFFAYVEQIAGTQEAATTITSAKDWTGFNYAISKQYDSPTFALILSDTNIEDSRILGTIFSEKHDGNLTGDLTSEWRGNYTAYGSRKDISYDFIIVAAKLNTSGSYQLLNFGGVRRQGDRLSDNSNDDQIDGINMTNNSALNSNGYEWAINGYCITEYLQMWLSKFYLPQYRDRTNSGYIPDPTAITYHGEFNSDFKLSVSPSMETAVNVQELLKYTTTGNVEKFLNVTTATTDIAAFDATMGTITFINDMDFSNIQFETNSDGINAPEYINGVSDLAIEFETGKNILLNTIYQSFLDAAYTVTTDNVTVYRSVSSTETTDSNNKKLSATKLYISNDGGTTITAIDDRPTITLGNYSMQMNSNMFTLSSRVDKKDVEPLSVLAADSTIIMNIGGAKDFNTSIPLNTSIHFTTINNNCPFKY